jgi:hypothetical protein
MPGDRGDTGRFQARVVPLYATVSYGRPLGRSIAEPARKRAQQGQSGAGAAGRAGTGPSGSGGPGGPGRGRRPEPRPGRIRQRLPWCKWMAACPRPLPCCTRAQELLRRTNCQELPGQVARAVRACGGSSRGALSRRAGSRRHCAGAGHRDGSHRDPAWPAGRSRARDRPVAGHGRPAPGHASRASRTSLRSWSLVGAS